MSRSASDKTGGYDGAKRRNEPSSSPQTEAAGDCPDCVAAGLHMKAQGFRDWRTGYACYEHAAVDLDGPWWASLMAVHAEARAALSEVEIQPDQMELFNA